MGKHQENATGWFARHNVRITLFGTLGVVVGAISLFSLATRVFDLGLSQVFSDFLAYYRIVTSFLFGWVEWIIGISLPQFLKDLWVLSFLGIALEYRSREHFGSSYIVVGYSSFRGFLSYWFHPLFFHLGRIAMGFVLAGILLFPLAMVFSWYFRRSRMKKMFVGMPEDIGDADIPFLTLSDGIFDAVLENRRAFVIEGLKTFIILSIFFALNAYAPSIQ